MDLTIRDLQYEAIPERILREAVEATVRLIDLQVDVLSLVFVDDAQIREINRDFRNRDVPTDVISFEAEGDGDAVAGEIIISVETARRQATAAGHSLETEVAWLVAHAVLHVAGMDDETEGQLAEMIALQQQVMAQIGREFAA